MNTSELRDELRRDAELAGLPPTDLVHRVAGLRRRSRRRWTTVLACACAVAVAVVGVSVLEGAREQDRSADSSAAATVVVDPEAAAQAYRESIANTGAAGSRAFVAGSLADFLPNTQYLGRDGGLFTLADAVVVGHVTSVSPGRAFHYEDAEHSTTEVPFDDPRAMWRTAHAEVAVTEVLSGQVQEGTIVVGVGVGPSFDVLAAGLPALGDLVLVLDSSSAVYDYDPTLWSVAEDQAVLAEIGSDGRLTFPALEPYRAEQFLAQNPTLDSLRDAARQPPRVLPFETLAD